MNKKYQIMWELWIECNLNCWFCHTVEKRNISKSILSIEKAKKLIDNLPSNSHISFIWWESFLYLKFIDILNYLENKKISYEITTNWSLIDKFYKQLNNLNFLSKIYFSIDWFWKTHDKIRWLDWLFNKIINHIPLINKNIIINSLLTEQSSFKEFIEMYKIFIDLKISKWRFLYYTNFSQIDVKNSEKKIDWIFVKTKFKGNIDAKINLKNSLNIYKKIRKINKMLWSKIKLEFNPKIIERKKKISSCSWLDKYFRINQEWKLVICTYIDNEFDSLVDTKFNKAILNTKYLKLKNKIKKNIPLDICKSCWKIL